MPPPLGLDVVSLRVEVDGGVRCCFVHERQDTDPSGIAVYRTQHVGYFSSLTDLIVRNKNLQTLYPNIPKAEVRQLVPLWSVPGVSLVVACRGVCRPYCDVPLNVFKD